MEIGGGASHNDSGSKTLLFPKWEREDKLKKIKNKNVNQDNRSATLGL